MNPDGYCEGFTEEQSLVLARVNATRGKLADSISGTLAELRAKDLTVGRGAAILYRHMTECGTEKKLLLMGKPAPFDEFILKIISHLLVEKRLRFCGAVFPFPYMSSLYDACLSAYMTYFNYRNIVTFLNCKI
jgi:hypothetical protein